MVVIIGLTPSVGNAGPSVHKYVLALLAVSVTEVPEHITVLLAAMLTVGDGLTETVLNAVPVHPPKVLVPVTVNVVVVKGLTAFEAVVGPLVQV